MTKITKEQFDSLNAEKGGNLKAFAASGAQVILRPMTRDEYDKLTMKLSRARNKDESLSLPMANAVRESLVFPSVEAFNALLEQKPALAMVFGEKLVAMAGAEEEAVELTFQ